MNCTSFAGREKKKAKSAIAKMNKLQAFRAKK